MGRYPIIQSPFLDRVERNLKPCPLYTHGFLGTDPRKLIEILLEDEAEVHTLGLTHREIADRLQGLTDAARDGWGDPVEVEGRYRVEVHEVRGMLPCPWQHPGLFPKTHVRLETTDTHRVLYWTDLSIHMIREHGFYQGKGSPYRLEPRDLKEVLGL